MLGFGVGTELQVKSAHLLDVLARATRKNSMPPLINQIAFPFQFHRRYLWTNIDSTRAGIEN